MSAGRGMELVCRHYYAGRRNADFVFGGVDGRICVFGRVVVAAQNTAQFNRFCHYGLVQRFSGAVQLAVIDVVGAESAVAGVRNISVYRHYVRLDIDFKQYDGASIRYAGTSRRRKQRTSASDDSNVAVSDYYFPVKGRSADAD